MKLCKDCRRFIEGTKRCGDQWIDPVDGFCKVGMPCSEARLLCGLWEPSGWLAKEVSNPTRYCKYCGRMLLYTDCHGSVGFYLTCTQCGARGPFGDTKESAATNWDKLTQGKLL